MEPVALAATELSILASNTISAESVEATAFPAWAAMDYHILVLRLILAEYAKARAQMFVECAEAMV